MKRKRVPLILGFPTLPPRLKHRRTNHTSHKPFLLSHLRRPTLSTPLPTALPPLPHYPQSHKPVAIIIIISRVSESRPTKARHNRRSSTATRKQNPSPLQADAVAVAAPSRPQPGPVAVAASHLTTRRCKSFPGPAPTQHGSQIDHSFPFLESLNELLKKHGWKEGTGLGISEQGRIEPVETYVKNNKRGLGLRCIF
ncbi:hypothetical protein RIF29_25357 [Crotalaria pallida]|uniref:G-patch domain-containing protein n=1 Tax=Crotalaria pallida TaxID=3830 RepID=A0AAN9EMA3_CROPI